MPSWKDEFVSEINNPPTEDTVLKCLASDKRARLDVILENDKEPCVYGRAFVPCVVGQPVGWFLQPEDCTQPHGLKCILLPKARDELFKQQGIEDVLYVKSLRIVKWAQSRSSVLCTIEEF